MVALTLRVQARAYVPARKGEELERTEWRSIIPTLQQGPSIAMNLTAAN